MSHTDNELRLASRYFVYHLKMYIETFNWLHENQEKNSGWNTIRNAMLEDHLIHARVLINFFFPKSPRIDDVIITDYINFAPGIPNIIDCNFLNNQVDIIGGQLVHLTKKQLPITKSDKSWPISEIKNNLVPLITRFIDFVPDDRLYKNVKEDCQSILLSLKPKETLLSVSSST